MLNEWLLGYFFSPDGAIDARPILWFIRTFQLVCLGGGTMCVLVPGRLVDEVRRAWHATGHLFRRPAVILCVAIVGGAGLRLAAIPAKRSITHDEAFAYLAATGTTGDVTVTETDVRVIVTVTQPLRLLPLPDRQITVTAVSSTASDVLEAGP